MLISRLARAATLILGVALVGPFNPQHVSGNAGSTAPPPTPPPTTVEQENSGGATTEGLLVAISKSSSGGQADASDSGGSFSGGSAEAAPVWPQCSTGVTDRREGRYVDEDGNELPQGIPAPVEARQFGYDPVAIADPVHSVAVQILVVWYTTCRSGPGAAPETTYEWGPPPSWIDPITLVDDAHDLAVSQVFPPASLINPPQEAPYQLGLWLAVTNQGIVEATASASPTTWAQTTATLHETTFDFGPHGTVTCDGYGVPIADDELDTIEPGPCGFTFTTDHGDTVDIAITSTWHVVTTTSDGRSVTHPDLNLTSTVPGYEIYEIVTVGVANR